MGAITQPTAFVERVARLEGQNRILKRVGLFLFCTCFLSIGLIAWHLRSVSRAPTAQGRARIISAHQFNLLDENGKIQGLLTGTPGGAMLFLNGPHGKVGLSFHPDEDGSSLSLRSANGEQTILETISDTFSSLTFSTGAGNNRIQMIATLAGGNLTVSDAAGFEAALGNASLVKPENGEGRATSAATLTLFKNDGHVMWMTPKP